MWSINKWVQSENEAQRPWGIALAGDNTGYGVFTEDECDSEGPE